MSNPTDYTVGWISAIHTEFVAAQAFLDEKHEGPEYVSPHDNNDYILGRIGKHNVVIAVLPDGEYGLSTAASVARDMLHSFPNVRIGLMVGIGGGAPSLKHDIRLGDIVVSASRDGNGGVFQYDFGKTIQDRSFQQTRFLDQPPAILRAAVNGLKARYESDGHQLEEAISSILEKKPRLRKNYKRPDPSRDRLYQSVVVHPQNDEASCIADCGDDLSNLILRSKRTEDIDNPTIHYGLIASANQLMKDALVRDRLAAEKDVLCFEMEAAGLMSHFPCLVIRGICDYSDSHKSKEWQGYAAMAAAAYTKDLLYRIAPNRVEAEEKISDILSGIQDSVGKLLHMQHNEEYKSVLDWLTPIDYATQQSDIISRKQEGTGLWLLTSEEFQQWIDQSGKTLFCPGIPGAGKTMMSSIVVDHLNAKFENNADVGIACIYCNYQPQQEQNPVHLLLSILKQLVQERAALPAYVRNLYEQHEPKRARPSFDDIVRALHSTIKLYSRVFIVIDALDEYYASNNEGYKRLLSGVYALQDQVQLNLFATSRFVSEIITQFDGCISKEIRAQDDDVLRYVNGRIYQLLQSQISKHPQVEDAIRRDIVKAADGMFLLARLHMDSLMSQPTLGHIKQVLRDLPQGMKGLDETYKQAMKRIDGQSEGYRELAKRVLSWVIYAKRALSTAEMQHAVAVNVEMVDLDEDFLPAVEIIGSVCAGLVTVDQKSDVIRLVHYTTKEYFDRTSLFSDAETYITQTCVIYLSFNTFATGFCETDKDFETRLHVNLLYDYAARHWGHHALAASTEVEMLILGLLRSESKLSAASQAMLVSKGYHGYSQSVPRQLKGVHIAAYFGLNEAIIVLLENEHNLNTRDSYHQTPLSWAAESGHKVVVELLLEKGAELESKDSKHGRTPLLLAAENGHKAVVELLLEKGAELESKDSKYGQAPLSWAAENGHKAVVELLLEKGAELESKSDNGRTSLSWAAKYGHKAVIELLLEKGAELESKDSKWGQTPLSWAAENGHKAVVELLLEKGAELGSKSNNGQTSLSWAVRDGHKAVVELLLEKGAELESKSNNGQTPLSWAVRDGHKAVVELLLEKDAELESKSDYGQTPLSFAAENGHKAVVELLLEKGAELESKSNNGQMPLSFAAENGHKAVVELLLEKGAELESKSDYGQTPLSFAAENGHKAVVELLLEKGAELESKSNNGQTPLSWAAENGHKAVVELLLEKGAELESKSDNGQTSLSWAAKYGHKAVVELLLEKGAELESRSYYGQTPLSLVAENGQKAVVELLLEKGAELESEESIWGRTPLLLAAESGHKAVVELLLEKGAELESKSNNGQTPLSFAAENGHKAVVELLLEKGAELESKSNNGQTPLSWAAVKEHNAVVELLLESSAGGGIEDKV